MPQRLHWALRNAMMMRVMTMVRLEWRGFELELGTSAVGFGVN